MLDAIANPCDQFLVALMIAATAPYVPSMALDSIHANFTFTETANPNPDSLPAAN